MFERYLRRFRSLVGAQPTPIKPSHLYVDTVTDEAFVVESVGPNVQIARQDAERYPETTVRKTDLRVAIDAGMVVHDQDRCSVCRDNSN